MAKKCHYTSFDLVCEMSALYRKKEMYASLHRTCKAIDNWIQQWRFGNNENAILPITAWY